VILLGVVVAVEDRFDIVVTRAQLERVYSEGGSSLRKLAQMIEDLQDGRVSRDASSRMARLPEHSGP
jgi:hypothetical protein